MTLATFRTLEHQHLVPLSAAEQAALDLLRAIGDRSKLSANLSRLLRDALNEGPNSGSTDEAFGHIGKSADDRGAEIIDLLLLTDAYPVTALGSALTFPGIPETRG